MYLEQRPLPDQEWLLKRATGAMGGRAQAAIEAMFENEETWQHPDVKRAYPQPIVKRLKQQWIDRDAFQAAVTSLPDTLCHNDSHDENLFSRTRTDGTQETIAIDWELVGIGPVSSDITYLVIATLRRLAVPMEDADALEGCGGVSHQQSTESQSLRYYSVLRSEANWRTSSNWSRESMAAMISC